MARCALRLGQLRIPVVGSGSLKGQNGSVFKHRVLCHNPRRDGSQMVDIVNRRVEIRSNSPQFVSVVKAYVALTKPRIIELLLVTTVPAMMLAARGLPSIGLLTATLVGGTLAAGSANAMNCYYDRDIDAIM